MQPADVLESLTEILLDGFPEEDVPCLVGGLHLKEGLVDKHLALIGQFWVGGVENLAELSFELVHNCFDSSFEKREIEPVDELDLFAEQDIVQQVVPYLGPLSVVVVYFFVDDFVDGGGCEDLLI